MKEEEKPKVSVGGKEYDLDESQTGDFGVTEAELQMITLMVLKKAPSRRCSQRSLFKLVVRHMGVEASSKKREELLRIFVKSLRALKEQGIVEFVSGATRVFVKAT
jgi:hypothetical protein